jgi:hypothetical protein
MADQRTEMPRGEMEPPAATSEAAGEMPRGEMNPAPAAAPSRAGAATATTPEHEMPSGAMR